MKSSLTLLPLLLAVVVLGGCPDSKVPKVPPKVPEPKATSSGLSVALPTDTSQAVQQRGSA
jgi:hypothetical protein